jgi:hypothetical protein
MRSSRTSLGLLLGLVLFPLLARAQTPVEGFDVERLYPSAPGAGWFVMDSLDMHGDLGGALAFSARYAHQPLRLTGAPGRGTPVSDSAYGQIAGAITWRSLRFSFGFDFPLAVKGPGATVGGYEYPTVGVDLGSNPDTLSDVRIGVDARLLGEWNGPFRLGIGAQLWIPSGETREYLSDGTYRGMVRLLLAGDVGAFTWAGQLGVHVRPRDDGGVPGGPRGSELLFGAAAGAKLFVGEASRTVVGPEVYGATAFAGFFKPETTSAEALLSARWEGTGGTGPQLRVRLGGGLGLGTQFATPAWRVLLGIEVFTPSAPASE